MGPSARALPPVRLTGQNCCWRDNEEPFGAVSWVLLCFIFIKQVLYFPSVIVQEVC